MARVNKLEAELAESLQGQKASSGEVFPQYSCMVTSSIVNKVSAMVFDDEAKIRIFESFHQLKGVSNSSSLQNKKFAVRSVRRQSFNVLSRPWQAHWQASCRIHFGGFRSWPGTEKGSSAQPWCP